MEREESRDKVSRILEFDGTGVAAGGGDGSDGLSSSTSPSSLHGMPTEQQQRPVFVLYSTSLRC